MNIPPLTDKERKKLYRWIQNTFKQHYRRKNLEILSFKIKPFKSDDGRHSSLYNIKIHTSMEEEHDLVGKILPKGLAEHDVFNTLGQFRNEALFFSKLLPLLIENVQEGKEKISYFFSNCSLVHQDDYQYLIAFENLCLSGFKLADKTLDIDHFLIAMTSLGQFHGLSYAAKRKNRDFFLKEMGDIRCPRYYPKFEPVIASVVLRYMQYGEELLRQMFLHEHRQYAEKISAYLNTFKNNDDMINAIVDSVKPVEPMAVLCHGDLTRNNVMFKYDEENKPIAMKFIDFQLAIYASPSVDISVLLYLNTTPETRQQHWDEIFNTYRAGVLKTLEKCCPEDSREQLDAEYSLENIMEDFARFGIHGLFISSFFLEITMLSPAVLFSVLSKVGPSLMTTEGYFLLMTLLEEVRSSEVKRRLACLMKELVIRKHI